MQEPERNEIILDKLGIMFLNLISKPNVNYIDYLNIEAILKESKKYIFYECRKYNDRS